MSPFRDPRKGRRSVELVPPSASVIARDEVDFPSPDFFLFVGFVASRELLSVDCGTSTSLRGVD